MSLSNRLPADAFSELLFAHLKGLINNELTERELQLWRIAYSEALRQKDGYGAAYFEQATVAFESQVGRLCEVLKDAGTLASSVRSEDVATVLTLIEQGHVRMWLLGRGNTPARTHEAIRRHVTLFVNGLGAG